MEEMKIERLLVKNTQQNKAIVMACSREHLKRSGSLESKEFTKTLHKEDA